MVFAKKCKKMCIENRIGPKALCLGELPGKKRIWKLVQKSLENMQNENGTLLRHSVLFQHPENTLMAPNGEYPKDPLERLFETVPFRVPNCANFRKGDPDPQTSNGSPQTC